jgi:hypothetical protein
MPIQLRRYRKALLLIVTLFFLQILTVQAKLPDCEANFAGSCFYSGITYKDGKASSDIYEGEVKNGLRHGNGTYTFADGKKYIGQFKDDQYSGAGTLLMADGSRYVGQFKDDQFNGLGTYTWSDQSKYVGQFLNGGFYGKGTYTWPDGRKYVGEWKENRKNGFGILYLTNGAVDKQGIFKDDVLVQAQTPVQSPQPLAPKLVTPTSSQSNTNDNAAELKRQRCIKLGLSPGSEDYKQCMM